MVLFLTLSVALSHRSIQMETITMCEELMTFHLIYIACSQLWRLLSTQETEVVPTWGPDITFVTVPEGVRSYHHSVLLR